MSVADDTEISDDIEISGVYALGDPNKYEIEIDTSTTFLWRRNDIVQKANVPIKGVIQEIQDGLIVDFKKSSNFTTGNTWVIKGELLYAEKTEPTQEDQIKWAPSVPKSIGDLVHYSSPPPGGKAYLFKANSAGTTKVLGANETNPGF